MIQSKLENNVWEKNRYFTKERTKKFKNGFKHNKKQSLKPDWIKFLY